MGDQEVRAAAYVRISHDPQGKRAGVQRQRDDCLALIEQRGWALVSILEDNDRSAYSGKPRPQYRRLLDGLKDGSINAVVTWHPDRLHRSPAELEQFVSLIEATEAQVATCTAGDVDLSTPDGRFMARILGAVARKESEDKGRRVSRAKLEKARQGQPPGGGRRPFGYAEDRMTIVEDEARLITEAARRILSGESVYSVTQEWNERGITSSGGGRWTIGTLRRVLSSARIAGLRDYKGEPMGEAAWQGIIDRETHERLRALFAEPSRRVNTDKMARRWLLPGLIRCGRCGRTMSTVVARGGTTNYSCRADKGGCSLSVVAERTDDLVRDAVLMVLSDSKRLSALLRETGEDDHSTDAASLAELEARAERLDNDFYVHDRLPEGRYRTLRAALDDEIAAVRSKLATRTANDALVGVRLDEDGLTEAWESRGLAWRRSLLSAVLTGVVIQPGQRGRGFDPERVRMEWRAAAQQRG